MWVWIMGDNSCTLYRSEEMDLQYDNQEHRVPGGCPSAVI